MFGYISLIADAIELMARGGGGGSGGGGGGGSAGGSGGGGGLAIIAMVGYVPLHFIASKLRKLFWETHLWIVAQASVWIVALLVTVLLPVWIGWIGIIIGMGALIGAGTGLYGALEKLRRRKQVKLSLAASAANDPAWNEVTIQNRVREVFAAYQADWTNRNWEHMRAYMTPTYHQHATLMIVALLHAKRINNVADPIIDELIITDMRDSEYDEQDKVTVGITAHARDQLIDEETGDVLYTDTNPFVEYWHFQRMGDTWMLDGIDQATADEQMGAPALRKLAADNGYFYSLDWGWLLIPKRGHLFGNAKFGTSDINNHVIGIYNNSYLLQLYTYTPNPTGQQDQYLIAQTNVPRSYGRIVVRRKKWTNFMTPRGLRKISMEWGDFNKKYDVYASSAEGPTSFELLHPVYMERLEALKFEVNIEVVDNVVYLYAPHGRADEFSGDYAVMLELLREAYKQMRM